MGSGDASDSAPGIPKKLMTPNERFEYHITHMGDPEYREEYLKSLDLSNPLEKALCEIESHTKTYRIQKRKPSNPKNILKSFDPATVHKVLLNLQTPATFSGLMKNRDRLNNAITASSLRQYVDALLTRGYITLADYKQRDRDYTGNFVPRVDFTLSYVTTRGGRKYVKAYAKILEMLSELDPKGHLDRL